MPTTQLFDRTVIVIAGPDAQHFLHNIITTDLESLGNGEAKPGALLTPQGKILFDFLISRAGADGFFLDCRADVADDFVRRLMLYRLRAKAEISKQEQAVVLARWQNDSPPSSSDSTSSRDDSGWLADTRFPGGTALRGYGIDAQPDATPEDFTQLRIAHGIAESGDDFAPGDAFPHDVLLDQAGGVGFRKGCYVGQEVVSRMQHRGTARRRVMLAQGGSDLPESGTTVEANGRTIGTLGGVSGRHGLAIMRIDRVKDALDTGQAITAGGVALTLSIPAWATYTLPQEPAGAGEA